MWHRKDWITFITRLSLLWGWWCMALWSCVGHDQLRIRLSQGEGCRECALLVEWRRFQRGKCASSLGLSALQRSFLEGMEVGKEFDLFNKGFGQRDIVGCRWRWCFGWFFLFLVVSPLLLTVVLRGFLIVVVYCMWEGGILRFLSLVTAAAAPSEGEVESRFVLVLDWERKIGIWFSLENESF